MIGKGAGPIRDDKVSLTLAFEDGSFGTVHYLANGHKSFPKERLEIFGGGRILQLDNFRVLRGYGWPGFKQMKLCGGRIRGMRPVWRLLSRRSRLGGWRQFRIRS